MFFRPSLSHRQMHRKYKIDVHNERYVKNYLSNLIIEESLSLLTLFSEAIFGDGDYQKCNYGTCAECLTQSDCDRDEKCSHYSYRCIKDLDKTWMTATRNNNLYLTYFASDNLILPDYKNPVSLQNYINLFKNLNKSQIKALVQYTMSVLNQHSTDENSSLKNVRFRILQIPLEISRKLDLPFIGFGNLSIKTALFGLISEYSSVYELEKYEIFGMENYYDSIESTDRTGVPYELYYSQFLSGKKLSMLTKIGKFFVSSHDVAVHETNVDENATKTKNLLTSDYTVFNFGGLKIFNKIKKVVFHNFDENLKVLDEFNVKSMFVHSRKIELKK